MAIYFTGENAEEAKALMEEMQTLPKRARVALESGDLKGSTKLLDRHAEIAARLRELDQTPS